MANNVIDAAIRLRDLFTPTVRSVNASLGTMKTQMAAAKQSVSGLSDKLTEHEHIQQTRSKISGLSDKMALLNHEAIISPQVFDWVQEERQESLKGLAKASLAVLVEMTQNCIAENARGAQDQGEYQKRYNGLVERYEKAKTRFDEVMEAIAERSAKGERLRREVSPFRGRGSSGHLRRRRSLWQSSMRSSGARWWTM